MSGFTIKSDYKLDGDQPEAVDQLVEGLKRGDPLPASRRCVPETVGGRPHTTRGG